MNLNIASEFSQADVEWGVLAERRPINTSATIFSLWLKKSMNMQFP
jgi:hypothetical protein